MEGHHQEWSLIGIESFSEKSGFDLLGFMTTVLSEKFFKLERNLKALTEVHHQEWSLICI